LTWNLSPPSRILDHVGQDHALADLELGVGLVLRSARPQPIEDLLNGFLDHVGERGLDPFCPGEHVLDRDLGQLFLVELPVEFLRALNAHHPADFEPLYEGLPDLALQDRDAVVGAVETDVVAAVAAPDRELVLGLAAVERGRELVLGSRDAREADADAGDRALVRGHEFDDGLAGGEGGVGHGFHYSVSRMQQRS
jgi:hypothetical protein